jgi:transcription termination/antitermination protein NusG
MDYYAIQVWTGKESEFADRLKADHRIQLEIIVPKRAIVLRKTGKARKIEKPLFAGYVFIATETPGLDLIQRWVLRTTHYFIRTLPTTSDPIPVKEKDRRLLSHFMSFGKVADISKVHFDEDDRIVVVEGPLKGIEGLIVRVDKRKRRAKIRLDMCENSFLVDLGFEIIDKSAKGTASDDGNNT